MLFVRARNNKTSVANSRALSVRTSGKSFTNFWGRIRPRTKPCSTSLFKWIRTREFSRQWFGEYRSRKSKTYHVISQPSDLVSKHALLRTFIVIEVAFILPWIVPSSQRMFMAVISRCIKMDVILTGEKTANRCKFTVKLWYFCFHLIIISLRDLVLL